MTEEEQKKRDAIEKDRLNLEKELAALYSGSTGGDFEMKDGKRVAIPKPEEVTDAES